MQSGLVVVTHYSLLAIAVISSCCLFYLVASENAKNTATVQLHHQCADSADVSKPKLPFEKVNDDEAAVFVKADQKTGRDETIVESNSKNNGKILKNYEKTKKATFNRQRNGGAFSHSHSISLANIFMNEEKSDVSPRRTNRLIDSDVLSHKNVDGDGDVDKTKNLENFKRNHDNLNLDIQSNAENMNGVDDETLSKFEDGLPNIITDIPAVTVTELPLEALQPMQSSLNAILVEASNKKSNAKDAENDTVDMLESKDDQPQQGDEIIKINDSGGDGAATTSSGETSSNQASNDSQTASSKTTTTTTTTTASEQQQQEGTEQSTTTETGGGGDGDGGGGGTVNLTNEEVPMPVFSEWAQKQMEAAEKQQQLAKEQEVVNTIAQKKNLTNGSKKLPPLKMRAKNYASPDCGAKIIASNADATNTGAVLSSSKDEYMLSPCGNRIWFVVELCEAIQAQKVDLANFELFSSSPKNFTVAVSNRFPTREWSNVGRFVAEDKRNVQSFDLHPHLFGKFVRVDIHSHHSQEHFCPVSLFRVFGTSEIEAFETENHPDDDMDDFDDEVYAGGGGIDQANNKNTDNIFKSASDAVLSIVKKAAEVLVKPVNNIHNRTFNLTKQLQSNQLCRSILHGGEFNCPKCSANLAERINNILSCEFRTLDSLLSLKILRNDLLNTQICAKYLDLDMMKAFNDDDCSSVQLQIDQRRGQTEMDIKRSYYLNLLPEDYIGALCYSLSSYYSITSTETTRATLPTTSTHNGDKSNEMALNLTIDKKIKTTDFQTLEGGNEGNILRNQRNQALKTSNIPNIPNKYATEINENNNGGGGGGEVNKILSSIDVTTEANAAAAAAAAEIGQIKLPPSDVKAQEEESSSSTAPMTPQTQDTMQQPKQPTVTPDVNIYNIPVTIQQEQQDPVAENRQETSTDNKVDESANAEIPVGLSSMETQTKIEDDTNGNIWDNVDSLLPTNIPQGNNFATNHQAQSSNGGTNIPQKIPGGPQSESIFIRLSNRIKALERNMSLSGQYLEELSRRYKKQVEELQHVLTQQSQTVRNLEDQNRRHIELQELYKQSNIILKNEVDNMALQVHACIVVIIVVGAFVILLLVVSILFYRAIWRRGNNKAKHSTTTTPLCGENKTEPNSAAGGGVNQKKYPRRKSFDEYSDHGNEKMRRPSEEVTDILKKHLDIPEKHRLLNDKIVQTQQAPCAPQRKISICYGGSSNPTPNQLVLNHQAQETISKGKSSTKRKNAKLSWSNSNDTNQMALDRLESMRGMDVTLEEYKRILEAEKYRNDKLKSPKAVAAAAAAAAVLTPAPAKPKRKLQNFRRQKSAPADCPIESAINFSKSINDLQNEFNEHFILDEEDLDNFIPNSDLAYNEFMPEGPSGYQIVVDSNDRCAAENVGSLNGVASNGGSKEKDKTGKKKSRRISSPGFFKTSLTKALKGKAALSTGNNINNNNNNNNTAPITSKTPYSRATSWEWHRLKNSSNPTIFNQSTSQFHNSSSSSVKLLRSRGSPTGSLDASTLSEIHFPTHSTENSFRILEEAILSSGEAVDHLSSKRSFTKKNGGSGGSGSGSGGNKHSYSATSSISGGSNSSERSSISNSTSSSTKKKQRGFHRIFRKVF